MPDPAVPPPLHPKESSGAKLAWVVVLVSVIFLGWTANDPLPGDESNVDASESANDLAILKLQSRIVIGLMQFPMYRLEATRNLEQLTMFAGDPKSTAAVAIVNVFADPENGLDSGLELLDELGEMNAEQVALIEKVRSGLEMGVTPQERADLEPELGWFSELIKPRAEDGGDFGSSIRGDAVRSMMILFVFFIAVVLAIGTGLILLILFLVNRASGKWKSKSMLRTRSGFSKLSYRRSSEASLPRCPAPPPLVRIPLLFRLQPCCDRQSGKNHCRKSYCGR